MKVPVRLSEKEFVRFGMFDAFQRRQGWRRPAIFALLLGAFSVLCFIFHQRQGAVFLGSVLLLVALGLPAAYCLSFFLSLRKQARDSGLAEGRYVYTLDLYEDGKGVAVDNGQERAAYSWEQVFHAYRDADATYLYVTSQRAFLLPHACVKGGGDRLWELLERNLPKDKLTLLRPAVRK